MSDVLDVDLYRRTKQFLEPGEIELNGVIVHTGLGSDQDVEMTQATLDVGEVIADAAGVEDWFVYSGVDDPEYASNQHQGKTLPDEEFVWECQQLLREGSFDLVFYYEADADQEAILAGVRELGFEVTSVEG